MTTYEENAFLFSLLDYKCPIYTHEEGYRWMVEWMDMDKEIETERGGKILN
jgi:hypothetical protein